MMKLIKKILVATDFNKSSENVLKNAMTYAKTFNSKITLIHILPDDVYNEKVSLMLNNAADTQLKAAYNKIANEGIKTDPFIIEYGNYCDKIVNASDRIDANLLIIGSGEKLESDNFQLGSTAEKIIRKSNKPVLVIKNSQISVIKNIICPVDFSKESEGALNSAIIISRLFEAKIVILSVFELFTGSFAKLNVKDINETRRLEHEKEFNSFLRKFNLIDLKFEKEIKGGEPAKEILKVIKDKKSDLLIMGTTGKSGISRILLGSVTEKVIRQMPCSFITVKKEDIITLDIDSKIKDIESHFNNAQELFENGLFEEAISEYKKSLDINFMYLPSLKGMSKVYKKLEREEDAKKYDKMAKDVLDQRWNMKIEEEIRSQRKH